jgi:hypothetical protein
MSKQDDSAPGEALYEVGRIELTSGRTIRVVECENEHGFIDLVILNERPDNRPGRTVQNIRLPGSEASALALLLERFTSRRRERLRERARERGRRER